MASTGVYARYWLPALIWWLLVLVAALARRWPERRVLLSLAIGASALGLGLHLRRQLRADPKLLSLAGNWRIATGQSTFAREYPEAYVYTVSEYINAHTPPNARVLMASFYSTFGASSFGGFWVDRPCYATDTHLESAIRFDDFQSFKQSLQRLGVTHVVISDKQFSAGRVGFDFVAGKNEYPFCRRLVDTESEKLGQFGPLQLYRLTANEALSNGETRDEKSSSATARK
jgi:hypothetical protein